MPMSGAERMKRMREKRRASEGKNEIKKRKKTRTEIERDSRERSKTRANLLLASLVNNQPSTSTMAQPLGINVVHLNDNLEHPDYNKLETTHKSFNLNNGDHTDSDVHIKHEIVNLNDIEQEMLTMMATVPVTEEPEVVTEVSTCNCSVEELLRNSYDERNFSRTLEIIRKGRPKPLIRVQGESKSVHNNMFKEHYYERIDWITGCSEMGRLYCWPCLLFDRISGLWNRTGFEDLGNFHKAFKCHENSQNHIVASMQLVAFVLNYGERTRSDTDEINEVIKATREALKSVVEFVCAVGLCRSAGINTRKLLQLTRRENAILANIPELHTDVAKAVTSALSESIAQSVKDTPFVSIFLDEIEGRIAAVFRYTNSKGELRDSFVGFMEGTDLGEAINNLQSKYNFKGKLVALLIGATSRVETLPEDPKLTVLHSPAHSMSYVLPFALQHIKECASFFHIIHCFELWLKDVQVEEAIKVKLPNSNLDKWRKRPITALYEQREIIQDVVLALLDKPTSLKSSSYTTALALQHGLKDLEFTFLLRVFQELFPATDVLQDMIINNSPNMKVCSETVDDYIKVLNWKKEKFQEIWESVQEVYLDGPATKKPRHGGTSKLLTYYRTLYETIIDAVVSQIKLRFASVMFLEFVELLEIKNSEQVGLLEKHMVMLRSKRDDFESTRLRNELIVAYAQVDFNGLKCEQLLRHLYDTGLGRPLRQVTRLARLILMYPYASKTNYDSCTRMFSKIHNFAQRLSSEPELLNWSLLTLENRLLNQLTLSPSFLEKAVQFFADSNPHIQLTLVEPKSL